MHDTYQFNFSANKAIRVDNQDYDIKIKGKKIIITGAGGYIGTTLTPFLLKNGFFLDEETIILTTPYETLLFLDEKELPPNSQSIVLDIVASRAKGVKMVCE